MKPEIVGCRIKRLMELQNINLEQLAEKLGLTKKRLEKKLNGKEEFYISQIMQIKEIFNLDLEVFTGIFFEKDFIFKEKVESSI